MSPNTMISALSTQTDSHTIHARVGRVWEAINKNTNTLLHTNITLLDEENNHILATIRNNQKHVYLPLLREQAVYNISNFKVVPGPALYRAVDRELSINFFYKTKIQEKPDTVTIPRYKFEIQPFDKVRSMVGQTRCLIGENIEAHNIDSVDSYSGHSLITLLLDVIGMVTSYGRLEKRANGAEKMDILLTDSRNEKMLVTLWAERAQQFKASLEGVNESVIFVVITGLLAKKFSENASLSSTDATKTYFNIDYSPLDELKESLSTKIGKSLAELPPPTTKQFVSVDDKTVQQLDINSILEMQIPAGKDLVRCLCSGTITEILDGNGWYYNCCTKCGRAVRPLEGKHYCNTCREDVNPVSQRYRVVVRIQDVSGTTTLTLFNKEAEQLIGVQLQKLLTELDEDAGITKIPSVVKNIIGKMCDFQIKVTSYNITHGCEEYTVTRVSECPTTAINDSGAESTEGMKKRQKLA